MAERLIIAISRVDSSGSTIHSKVVSDKEILHPKDIADLGYNQQESLEIMKSVNDSLLNSQSDFLKSAS